jgi:magnesium-transporting ATPase (P-type)
MTGETDEIKKTVDGNLWMLSGCQVLQGRASMLVVAVGEASQWGQIKALVIKESEPTPLQHHLEQLAETIGKMGLVCATLTFLTLFIQWCTKMQNLHRPLELTDLGHLVDCLITAITIVVVAVPEGLPLAVTISLAYSMLRMMKDNNLVRHLEACEVCINR